MADYLILLKDILDQLPYWAFSLSIASGLYLVTGWFSEKHLSSEAKDTLALWLWGEYKATWITQFCNLFDAIFSNKHLSIRCFIRSAALSLLSVGILKILLDENFIHPENIELNIPIHTILFLGVILNVIPDYISLYETRFILYQFNKVTTIKGQCYVLIIDIVITGLIIWVYINVIHYLINYHYGRGGPFLSVSLTQMIMLYDEQSIFFYSTFVTSFWAWIYCLSCWIVRVFSPLRNILSISDKPLEQLALVCSVILFLLMFLFKPIFSSGSQRLPSFMDDIACYVSSKSCLFIAYLNKDTSIKEKYLYIGCNKGDGISCLHLGLKYEESKDYLNAKKQYENACNKGYSEGCLILGAFYIDQFDFAKYSGHPSDLGKIEDLDRAKNIFIKYCDKNNPRACFLLGLYQSTITKNYTIAVNFFKKACPKDKDACVQLGILQQNGIGIRENIHKAYQLFKVSCDTVFKINLMGCTRQGYLIHTGLGDERNREEAKKLYQLSCDNGYFDGCTLLGDLYNFSTSKTQLRIANKFYFRGCKGGDELGCIKLAQNLNLQSSNLDFSSIHADFKEGCESNNYIKCVNLAILLEYGLGTEKNITRAISLYSRACNFIYSGGCIYLAKLSEKNGHIFEAIKQYTKACNDLHPIACTKLGLLIENKDPKEAYYRFDMACNNGDTNACDYGMDLLKNLCDMNISWSCNQLGYSYYYGILAEKNISESNLLFLKACRLGNAVACFNLGNNYNLARGTRKNLTKAKELYKLACDGGFAKGCTILAQFLEKELITFKDPTKARFVYEKACEAGDELGCQSLVKYYQQGCNKVVAKDCEELGWYYLNGKWLDQDYDKAYTLFSKSCSNGYPLGCLSLGILYRDGKGLLQDYKKSKELFEEVCILKEPWGCFNLAIMYLEGLGLNTNYKEANELFTKTCDGSIGNLPDSCALLGNIYFYGLGVDVDHKASKSYYEKACSGGIKFACSKFNDLQSIGSASNTATLRKLSY